MMLSLLMPWNWGEIALMELDLSAWLWAKIDDVSAGSHTHTHTHLVDSRVWNMIWSSSIAWQATQCVCACVCKRGTGCVCVCAILYDKDIYDCFGLVRTFGWKSKVKSAALTIISKNKGPYQICVCVCVWVLVSKIVSPWRVRQYFFERQGLHMALRAQI